MTLIDAFNKKLDIISHRVQKLDLRSNPRIPHKLQWVGSYFKIFSGKNLIPKGHAVIAYYGAEEEKRMKIDQLARTFCALEDFENWLTKVEDGSKKHQQEIEKQAQTKIVRFKSFACMNFENSENPTF